MKVVIVNGSPRKQGNTATLCKAFGDGVRANDPNAQIIFTNLNDKIFKGCQSCFSCKLKNGRNYGVCSLKDEISPLLSEISTADCLVVASPIYLMDVSAATKAFLERLCFSLGSYETGYKSLAIKKKPLVTIYTMNTAEEFSPKHAMDNIDMFLEHIFTKPHRICAYNTYQFNDYSRYKVEVFDEKEKAEYRKENWIKDIENVRILASRIAQNILTQPD